jgi:CO dehydrogenase/acetyl-CoA synthase alpha subunit
MSEEELKKTNDLLAAIDAKLEQMLTDEYREEHLRRAAETIAEAIIELGQIGN